jgi:pyridoxamine 5'-phosphate oxidase
VDWPEELAALRREYRLQGIDIADVDPDPIEQFGRWFAVVRDDTPDDPNAMVLVTVDPDGRPSARTVLLKGVDDSGAFVFFTNYESRKARAIASESRVALLFSWVVVGRQYAIEGRAEQLSAAESDSYWETRPRGSQLGALASPQSSVVASRQELEDRYDAVESRLAGKPIARPDHWGGYRVVPDVIELWQGRENRLHDRFRYRRDASSPSRWLLERLAP